MPNTSLVVVLLVIGYALGMVLTPAAADDSSKIVDALATIARAEREQSESLRKIADSASKCARAR